MQRTAAQPFTHLGANFLRTLDGELELHALLLCLRKGLHDVVPVTLEVDTPCTALKPIFPIDAQESHMKPIEKSY